ncbi:MAG: TRAP transporter large permease subunit [Desulfuromonadales bacterium]|jgi:tripartite ATP-independent transporter DctM subunit|nr:TRAP transporter large permease subunit [Desulfuromonadales bacterium]MDH3807283.1 TRAP transporter large permease subunit [Desulfuromonadales bacterium]MDH3869515.1 TRAP transporter large permease subunit [Desulfuromonadales bacterium]MDH3960033.1 TRAP transporter large permease subunit [Desulfuromonadales bacterium]MDH4024065.1 TRAP transporter large permease subunit [Desulfuromonadales bacterium]
MSVEVLTILMFVTLMASIAMGHPLAVTLAAVATLFGLIDNGFNFSALLGLFANNAWGIFLNYTLVAIPLFIFMAQVLDRSKVSEGLFDALYTVLGGLRGGLGLAVIVVSTVFAATTGIVGASVVAMGLMAGPALLKRGYDKSLSAGIICSSGTLGILIPPSIMLVVYGGLTGQKETSVGNLFAAAILPGLLLSGMYLLYVAVRCYMNPKLGPPIPAAERTATVLEKFTMTMKNFVPPFGLILTVMGTILAGVATPTEAAALGCVGALVLALVSRKLNWNVITQACISTARTTAMIMALFVGGKFFSVVFLSMGGGDVVADVLLGMDVNRFVVFGIMMAVVFFMGMFIDWAAILLVVVPIFTPIAMDLDFNPLWFAMMICINLQTSFLTPPFGYSLFYFKGVAPPEYTMGDVYRGILPFVMIQVLALATMIFFPQIITYLPDVFFGR